MVATRQGTVEHVNRGGIKSSVIIVTVVCVAPAYLSQAKEKCTSSTRGRGLYMPPEGSFPMGFRTIGETVRLHRVPFAQRPQERTYGGGGHCSRRAAFHATGSVVWGQASRRGLGCRVDTTTQRFTSACRSVLRFSAPVHESSQKEGSHHHRDIPVSYLGNWWTKHTEYIQTGRRRRDRLSKQGNRDFRIVMLH